MYEKIAHISKRISNRRYATKAANLSRIH